MERFGRGLVAQEWLINVPILSLSQSCREGERSWILHFLMQHPRPPLQMEM